MALIACPECEGRVSDRAKACPHCGFELDGYRREQARLARAHAQRQARRARCKRIVLIGAGMGLLILCALCGLLILWPHVFHP